MERNVSECEIKSDEVDALAVYGPFKIKNQLLSKMDLGKDIGRYEFAKWHNGKYRIVSFIGPVGKRKKKIQFFPSIEKAHDFIEILTAFYS